MDLANKYLRVTMPNGELWDVPVSIIAWNRATYYKDNFGGSIQKSYNEDTRIFFEQNPDSIKEWAENNMNWKDVKTVQPKSI